MLFNPLFPTHMKKPSSLPIVLLVAAMAVLAFAACSRQDRAENTTPATDTPPGVAAPAGSLSDPKSSTFEQRDVLAATLRAQRDALEASLSQLRADYSEAQASESRRAAMNDLKNAELDYQEKLAALGTATADTWDAARDNVIASWDRLQASYARARAE